MNCRVTRCLARGHFIGAFQCPFCPEHFSQLTPNKMAMVANIATFSVLDPRSRTRAEAIITGCRRYLAIKEQKAHDHQASSHRARRVA